MAAVRDAPNRASRKCDSEDRRRGSRHTPPLHKVGGWWANGATGGGLQGELKRTRRNLVGPAPMNVKAEDSRRSRSSFATALLVFLAASARAWVVAFGFLTSMDRFDGWGQRFLVLAGECRVAFFLVSFPVVEAFALWIIPFGHEFPRVRCPAATHPGLIPMPLQRAFPAGGSPIIVPQNWKSQKRGIDDCKLGIAVAVQTSVLLVPRRRLSAVQACFDGRGEAVPDETS